MTEDVGTERAATAVQARTCGMPGCSAAPVPGKTRVGRPPEYCADPEHTPVAAWRARQAAKSKATGRPVLVEARPVDAARDRASAIKAQLTGMVEVLRDQLEEVVEALGQTADPDAAAAEIESITSEAAERVAAAVARAVRAEAAQRRAEIERDQADAVAVEATETAVTLQTALAEASELVTALTAQVEGLQEEQATERAAAAATQARLDGDLSEARTRISFLEDEAADAQAAHDLEVTARISAEEAARDARAVAEEHAALAREAAATVAAVREQVTALTGQLAEVRADAERAAAAAGVERERLAAEVAATRAQVIEADRARAAAEARAETARGETAALAERLESYRVAAETRTEELRGEVLELRTGHAGLSAALEAARAEVAREREHAEARIADLRAALSGRGPEPADPGQGHPPAQPERPARRRSRGGEDPGPLQA
jgi:colicin import membrane protein